MLAPGVIPPQVEDLTLAFVEFHYVPLCIALQLLSPAVFFWSAILDLKCIMGYVEGCEHRALDCIAQVKYRLARLHKDQKLSWRHLFQVSAVNNKFYLIVSIFSAAE